MKRFSFVLAAFALVADVPAAPFQQVTDRISFEQAIAQFDRICVQPLPDAQAFVDAMNTSDISWMRADQSVEERRALGTMWRSAIGRISYNNRTDPDRFEAANPSCHFEFRVGDDYTHDAAVAVIQQRFGLGSPCTRNRRDNQTRWEQIDTRNLPIKVYLTSIIDEPTNRWARLSISRRLLTTIDREHPLFNVLRCM